jgi:methyl-accepting chemotaxis protein
MGAFVSIRLKMGALIAGLGLATAALTALTMPRYAADAEREALEQRALASAAMLASAAATALDFDQPDTARDVISVASADRLVEWVAVYDKRGVRVAEYGSGSYGSARDIGKPRLLHSDLRSIIALAPATNDRGNVIGAVGVSMASQSIAQREESTRNRILMLSGLLSALFVLAAWILAGRMARVIGMMTQAAERIARGDVSQDLALPQSSDELGRMSQAFVEMTHRLRDLQTHAARVAGGDLTVEQRGDGELFVSFRTMVSSLRELARRINDSSESVASAAAALFGATREHEASATQQTASVEEMRRTLEALANSAERVNTDASQVRDMAERSLKSSQQTADQTKLVSSHSDRIGEILTLIQDIADKSDLLALNAALEGTKAGEVGRGFSLVAAEMRRLSEHVMDSVRDIRKLVADMRGASHASVLATEESIKLAKEAATSASKISDAVAHQREGTGQVKSAADEIVRVVNTSLDGTAQITRSAEALLQLSHELKSEAGAFRLDR